MFSILKNECLRGLRAEIVQQTFPLFFSFLLTLTEFCADIRNMRARKSANTHVKR
jgi:hypothetical protein